MRFERKITCFFSYYRKEQKKDGEFSLAEENGISKCEMTHLRNMMFRMRISTRRG